jgi:pimeloyl-ACP methyl ester carboxylesterase
MRARLNALPQFVTEVDGLNIHFIHVRSKHENALPLIVTHGWVIVQLKIIEPLTDPPALGGDAADAFHLVIPSMPGYGFSDKPQGIGWNTDRIARAWDTLMKRRGYTQYVSQGGDWGARVSEALAHLAPEGLLGVHMNLLLRIPPEIGRALALGEPAPAELSEQEKAAYEQEQAFFTMGRGYFIEQATRPQTIGHSLADSPVGLAAWMIVPSIAERSWADRRTRGCHRRAARSRRAEASSDGATSTRTPWICSCGYCPPASSADTAALKP